MTSANLLARLLEITPSPPESFDVDELLAAASIMVAARGALLATATEVLLAPYDHEQLAELHRREDAWRAAVSSAQDVVGNQRIGTAKLRNYAPPAAALR